MDDQLLFRPLIAWSRKFQGDASADADNVHPWFLIVLQRARLFDGDPLGDFAVFIGHIENGPAYPFEVWVNGAEQPRGLGAIAKTLSMDMRTEDRQWLDMKLSALQKASGDDAFDMAMPPSGEKVPVPSLVSGFAKQFGKQRRGGVATLCAGGFHAV